MRAMFRAHGRRIAGTLALAALALTLAACGGTDNGVNAPAGPAQGTITPSPAPSATPGATSSGSVHAGGASEDVVRAVTAALAAKGYKVASPSGVRVTYAGDANHVTVEGGGITTKDGRTVQRVELELLGGKWQVLNVTGQQ